MWETLLGAFKSRTVWLGLAVTVLSWVQQVVSGAAIPAEVVSVVGTVIGGLIVWLRALTTKALAEKVGE
jgi:hypothetical protein